VKVFLVGKKEDVRSPRASLNLKTLEKMKSVEFHELSSGFLNKLREALAGADFVVDALLGTGVKGELREPHASVVRLINGSRAFKLAVDVPSGLDPSTGEVRGLAVKADATITFHRAKVGLGLRKDLVGELVVVAIGVPPEAET
jgi:NAD(P)H-hydrate epimerase